MTAEADFINVPPSFLQQGANMFPGASGLCNGWTNILRQEAAQDYAQQLLTFLQKERASGKAIYPAVDDVFNALRRTPFEDVKVVIIGQDPYHGEGQAQGLSFSVPNHIRIPPSLRNIYKEFEADLGLSAPGHGCLEAWADRGVLLLNSVLTVECGKAGSHAKKGWEKLTDRIIQALDARRDDLVFVLWGAYAQKKASFVDEKRHLVLRSAHPSPLSVRHGFYGSRPFSKANEFRVQRNLVPIDWTL